MPSILQSTRTSILALALLFAASYPSIFAAENVNSASPQTSFMGAISAELGFNATDFVASMAGPLSRYMELAPESESCVLPLFGSPRRFSLGNNTARVAVADFNNDGHNDVAATAHDARRVGIYLGDGTGNFTQSAWLQAGFFSAPVALGDFNNDGNQDLAVGAADTTVWIYLGQGNGQFNSPQQYYDGNGYAYEIAVADFDLDGALDLAIGHQNGGLIIMRGNGSGSFTLWGGYLSSQGPVKVATADFNNDGTIDLITSNEIQTISVLLGNGSAGFLVATTLNNSSAHAAAGSAVGDFNADGNQDFATKTGDTEMTVFYGDGTGAFPTSFAFAATAVSAPLAVDMNADGILDLVAIRYQGNIASIMFGDGTGQFPSKFDFVIGNNPQVSAISDINEDARPDIVSANYGDGGFAVAMNNGYDSLDTVAPWIDSASDISVDSGGTGSANVTYNIVASDNSGIPPTFDCSPPSGSTFALGTTPVSCTAVDACGNRSGSFNFNVTVLCSQVDLSPLNNLSYTATSDNGANVNYPTINNITSVTYSIPSGSVFPIGQTTVSYTMTQECGNTFSGSFVVTINSNPEAEHCDLLSFDYPRYTPPVTGRWLEGLATGDLNGDGHLDLVSNEWADSQVRMHVYFGDGSGSYPTDTPLAWENEGYGISAIVIADFNNDGKNDIVATGGFSHTLYAYLGDGLGGFSVSLQSFYSSERWTDRLVYGDFDGDGFLDLVSRHESRNMYVHRGLGNGHFASPQFVWSNFATGRGYLKVVDLNADGKADILFTNGGATSTNENIAVMYGDGNGTFGSYHQGGTSGNPVDFNFDGIGDRIYAALVGLRLEIADGSGTYTQVPLNSTAGADRYTVDFNGDGLYDLVTFENAGNNNSDWWYPYYEIYLGQPAGEFSPPIRFRNWGDTYACVFGDANEDGRTDLIFSYLGRDLAVLLNEGLGDIHPPRIDVPENIVLEATGIETRAWWSVSSRDNSGFSATLSCDRQSGDPFPLGTTTVTCTATDYCGNSSSASFTVTVNDGPPVFNLPDVAVTATSPQVVTFNATATDVISGTLPATCLPASGSFFGVGITQVNCTATDPAGNTATGSFNVNVGPVYSGVPGELDTTFAPNPPSWADVPGVYVDPTCSYTRAMILQDDGMILIGGNVGAGAFSIQRLHANGTPDATFGVDGTGRSTPPFPGGQDATVLALAIQKKALPGGGFSQKILAAGMLNYDLWGSMVDQGDFVVARYNMDGSLDTSFGTGGVVITDMPQFSLLSSLGQLSDGKIVLGGLSRMGQPVGYSFAVALRYTVDGVLDVDFGNSGIASIGFGGDLHSTDSYAMVIQPDDKIVLGGYVSDDGTNNYEPQYNWDIALMRLNTDGSPDTSFGTAGLVRTDLKGSSQYSHEGIDGLALQNDGKIVAVADHYSEGVNTYATLRYNADGTLDTTFAVGGVAITQTGGAIASDVLVQPDNSIMVAGSGYRLVKYLPDGSLDTSFGNGGILSPPAAQWYDPFISGEDWNFLWFYSIARQTDGRIVIAGYAGTFQGDYNYGCASSFVVRYNSNVGGLINFSVPSQQMNEADGTATVTVVRTGLVSGTDSIDYAISNGTASAGSDYTAASGTLTFSQGETTKTFAIAIADDNLSEPNETVNVTLSNPTNGATLGSQSTATLTIVNDDKGASRTTISSVSVASASSVPLSATVNDSDSGATICDGNVSFTVSKGGVVVGTYGPIACSSGSYSATANLTASGTGSYSVFASFDGGAAHHPSSGSGSIAVGPGSVLTPTIGSISPTSTVEGSGETGITVSGSGFGGTSAVLWRDPITLVKTNLSVTARTSTELTAAVPAELLGRADAYQLTVDNTPTNTTDGESSPQTFFVTAEAVAVSGVTRAYPDPVTNTAETATSGPAGTLSAEASTQGGASAAGTLTLAQYAGDPVGEASGGSSTTTFSSTGSYFDVHVSSGATYTTLALNFCATGGTNLYWFDGNAWLPVSPQTYDSQTGCISVTLNNDPGNPSSPTISQLTGTVIAAAGGPEVRSITVTPGGPQAVGTTATLNASFADPNVSSSHTATIDWGDGSTPSSGSVSASSVTGTHVYSVPGVYRIAVRVTRTFDSAFGSATYQQFVVIYDPKGGFATGGGWINSPAGAYSFNPALVGRATFGFSSKYQKGGGLPTGDTQFNFHTAGLDFRSTSYQWLVVSGARAQYKGAGKINGAGDYSFILTAVDGQVNGGGGTDRFRIKIWDTTTGSILYDNQRGADDSVAPTTALGGGSIVVHK